MNRYTVSDPYWSTYDLAEQKMVARFTRKRDAKKLMRWLNQPQYPTHASFLGRR